MYVKENLSGFMDLLILWRFVARINDARAISGIDASIFGAESPAFPIFMEYERRPAVGEIK